MATIRPLPRFNIIKKSTRAKSFMQRFRRKVSVAAESAVINDVSKQAEKDSVDTGFCGEPFADHGELLSSLSPLLFSMKLCGLYFHRQDGHQRRAEDPECSAATKTRISWSGLRIYATIVLIFVWLNAIRLLSLFDKSDHFGALLLMKIVIFAGFSLTAIMYTACYYASHTGKLFKVLLTLPVTSDCVRGVRRVATHLTATIWIGAAVNMSILAYIRFTTKEQYDFMLAPFVTYISLPEDVIIIARIYGYLAYMFLFPGMIFSHGMNLTIVYTFCHEFNKLKKHFSRAVDSRGHFNGDLSSFRRRRRSTKYNNYKIVFGNYLNIITSMCSVDVTRRSVVELVRSTGL